MVYVFCRNAQSKPHSDPRDVCTLSLLYQLPNCNLFTQHALFILWRDTTSELWTTVQFPLYSFTFLLLLALFTFLHIIILLPLDTLIPLFTANRWDWQPHRKLEAKYLFMLCRFHVAAGGRHAVNKFSDAIVRSIMKLASITFWSLAFWYVSNVSIIFDAPCLFLHRLPIVALHLVALLCIFRN
jgi:hypothetical protein